MGGQKVVVGSDTLNGLSRPILKAALIVAVAVLSLFLMGWGATVWNGVRDAEVKNVEQDEKIKNLGEAFKSIDTKLDRLLERRP